MLVPMFAPITIGMAIFTVMTENRKFYLVRILDNLGEKLWIHCSVLKNHNLPFEATIETTTVVQVDELWTKTVNKTPIINPTIGLDNKSLSEKTEPEKVRKEKSYLGYVHFAPKT